MVVDLTAGGGYLLLHQLRQRAVLLRSGIREDGQRCVHRMGQIAGLGAGALHHVGVLLQHVVELIDQWLQLVGKAAFKLPGDATAHGGQAQWWGIVFWQLHDTGYA